MRQEKVRLQNRTEETVRQIPEEERQRLQARRFELKKILQGEFEDDLEFKRLTMEMADSLEGAASSVIEGEDRAVLLAAYLKFAEQLKKTTRFKLGQEFVKVQEKIKAGAPKTTVH